MYKCVLFITLVSTILLPISNSNAAPSFPDAPGEATEFFWEQEWGTIHMNTFADGLEDPGAPIGSQGVVPCFGEGLDYPCSYTKECESGCVGVTFKLPDGTIRAKPPFINVQNLPAGTGITKYIKETLTGAYTTIDNAIKFDIKNSVNNCMAKVMPNYPYTHKGWGVTDQFSKGICGDVGTSANWNGDDGWGGQPTLIYAPVWFRRSNDYNTLAQDRTVGCVQQISNSCVNDIFDCKKQGSDGLQGRGHEFPVSHVFTRQELKDLENPTQMPDSYYSYTKKEGTEERLALSLTNPTSFKTYVSGSKLIRSNENSVLGNIKTYKIAANPDTDMSGFITVDPSFYDLSVFKDTKGYNQLDSAGRVLTYKTCPILGLTGYSGICDPNGKAGCNVPIYGVGPQTFFGYLDNQMTLTWTAYPVIWSGYVKKWTWITPDQYEENTKDRLGKYEGRLYLDNDDPDEPNIAEGPILMVTRSDDYCTDQERYSGQVPFDILNNPPDMLCIQYFQYQQIDADEYTFLNLFSPEPDLRPNPKYAFSSLVKYNIVNDMPKYDEPVAGADFLSPTAPQYARRVDGEDDVLENARSQNRYDAEGSELFGTSNTQAIGEYLGDDASAGVGVRFAQGSTDGLRFDVPEDANETDISTKCAMVDNERRDPNNENIFIPTNSHAELQSFLTAANSGNIGEVTASECTPVYESYTHYNESVNGVIPSPLNPNGSITWVGTLSCASLKLSEKPACNQTKYITAQRTCLMEDGYAGDCSECMKARIFDPDANDFPLDNESVGGIVHSGPSYPRHPNKCYFKALCFNLNSNGCPGAGTSGGHVFCLSADTKITMADGSKKAIIEIKAGERVMAFSAKHSKQKKLKTALVKYTAVTHDQPIIKITLSGFYDAKGAKNTKVLKITQRHKMLRANGRAVIASDLYPGDQVIKANGRLATVTKIERGLPKINVYNLVLEDGADGYIANSMRVLSYPILRGMRIHSKTIEDEDN